MQDKRLKIIIAVLAVLLAVSSSALVGLLVFRYFYYREAVSVEVPGNIITPDSDDGLVAKADAPEGEIRGEGEKGDSDSTESADEMGNAAGSGDEAEPGYEPAPAAESGFPLDGEDVSVSSTKASAMTLYNKNPEANTSFHVVNVFPGDTVTKYYCLQVYHKGNVVVRYHADIRTGYDDLGKVLQLRVRLFDTQRNLLYDGPIDYMPESLGFPLNADGRTYNELYYDITAYLDTSVGNEFQNLELIADFRWWVEELDNLDAPQTGDTLMIRLCAFAASASLLFLLILLRKRRKEMEDEVQQQ